MNENPLAVPQREISGAQTFEKYEYQYHWALCRVIDEHSKLSEYALFMEYHEDVVLSDSLNCKKANFGETLVSGLQRDVGVRPTQLTS